MVTLTDAVVADLDAMSRTVAECVARAQRQDEEAARLLVEMLYPLVIKIVRANLPRRAAEEDLAQEIFAKMFANLGQYQAEVPVEHWVSRIAVNHCLNAIRAQNRRPEWRMADLSEEQASALEAVTADRTTRHPAARLDSQELVEHLLSYLGAKDRLIIRMLEIEDCSIDEIRQVTGWSGPMIRVRAFRARQKLNQRFRKLRSEGRL